MQTPTRPSNPVQPLQLFTARQPIFDEKRNVVAYELLFRNGPTNVFPAHIDPDVASSKVMIDALSSFGLDALLAEKRAFVNVTRRILVEGLYSCFPPDRLVIELLETLEADAESLSACQRARGEGYSVALDDFTGQRDLEPFMPHVDMVKVDLRLSTRDAQKDIIARFGKGRTLLAEKVENQAEFDAALALGFTRFQGFFFCRPEIIARKDIPSNKLVYLQFLRELARPHLDWRSLEQVIKLDVSISVKLLRYLNSAAFGWRREITSIRQALTMLGEHPFRRWSSLLVFSVMSEGNPGELLTTCLVRARLCELLAGEAGLGGHELDMFLIGMLSLVDTLIGRPLDELVVELKLPAPIASALTGAGEPSRMRKVLLLVAAYERAAWAEVDALGAELPLAQPGRLPALYQEAVQWATSTTF